MLLSHPLRCKVFQGLFRLSRGGDPRPAATLKAFGGLPCGFCTGWLSLRAMRLLDRYLFRDVLTPLLFCLGGFLIFWISFDLFNEMDGMQARKLHLFDVLEYVVAMTPGFLVTLLPIILLLALLHALTQHARYHEITAMRAAGISLWRICVPYFWVGALTGLALFGLSEFIVPSSEDWADHIKVRYVQTADDLMTQDNFANLCFKNPRANRIWYIGNYRIRAGEMRIVQVDWALPDGSNQRLVASRAVYTNRVWTFFDVKEYAQAPSAAQSGPTGTPPPFTPRLQTNELAVTDFDETPRLFANEIKIANYKTMDSDKQEIPLRAIIEYLRVHPEMTPRESGWLLTKLHGQLAAPFTCLVVVLIAIPFGAASGRRNLFVGVAGSVFICFAFFVVQKFGLALGAGGKVPAWLGAWLPNFFFALTGLVLTWRVR